MNFFKMFGFMYLIKNPITTILVLLVIITLFKNKERFIGTSMWYRYNFSDSNKTSKEDRTESLK